MTAISVEQLVSRIHDRPTRIVLAVTGGGTADSVFPAESFFDVFVEIDLLRTSPDAFRDFRREALKLPELLESLEVKSIVDVPCGDHGWMSTLDLSPYDYIGIDIVAKCFARRIEDDGDVLRGLFAHELVDHRHDAVQRPRGLAGRVGQVG